MKKIYRLRMLFTGVLVFALLIFAGCASIIKSGPQSVEMKSKPSGAKLVVYDQRTGDQIINATTPHTASLKRGAGYFKKAKYKIIVEKDGYITKEIALEGSPNGWYIGGNFIFGGLIGWFLVDPATGSMWTLRPEDVNAELAQDLSASHELEGLTVVLSRVDDLPSFLQSKLKPVNVD